MLLNVGAHDGIIDGWAAMDGIGLVGRVSGVGQNSSRVLLLTDTSSQIPVIIQPSGQRAFVSGDSTFYPRILFVETPELVTPGDRIVTSGDGGVFPPDILVGQLARGTDGQLRVRLAADYQRLEFLRILRSQPNEPIETTGTLVAPVADASAQLGQGEETPDG